MNTIEEKLWNYIDGTCTPVEQDAIASLIEQDEVYRKKYDELLALNLEFATMDLDEPSMAFTYNVMEAIRTENAMQPLKAAVDKRIIKGIAVFFVCTILALLAITFANVHFTGADNNVSLHIPVNIKVPNLSGFFSGPFMKWFLVFDVVLALFITDSWIRRKKTAKEV
jgi:hypothetical protein